MLIFLLFTVKGGLEVRLLVTSLNYHLIRKIPDLYWNTQIVC